MKALSPLSFLDALFIVLMAMKLTGYIAWSWWWVTAPLWMPWVVAFGFVFVLIGVACVLPAKQLTTLENVFKGLKDKLNTK